jgi:hypothetical protein
LTQAQPVHAAFIVTGISAAQWQTNDAALGMAGATFEDFEDVNIVPGLLIESQVPGTGGYGPTSTLPNTFDPRNTAAGGNDPVSNLFQAGLWDGTHLLINRVDNRMTGITNNYNDNR